MRIVIPGGTGQVGAILNRALVAAGHEVVILTRRPRGDGQVAWDGQTLGAWAGVIDGSEVVINLAGRSVSCRYTKTNLTEMMLSRVRSARVVGAAIAGARRPPRVWLQMSTATIYAHRFDAPNDEATGVIGGWETGIPRYWAYSVDIAAAWERELDEAPTPRTRKLALRSAMVMSPDRGSVPRAVAADAAWPRRPGWRRRAVRVLDSRARLRCGDPVPHRPRRPGRSGQSRRAGSAAAAGLHA